MPQVYHQVHINQYVVYALIATERNKGAADWLRP